MPADCQTSAEPASVALGIMALGCFFAVRVLWRSGFTSLGFGCSGEFKLAGPLHLFFGGGVFNAVRVWAL